MCQKEGFAESIICPDSLQPNFPGGRAGDDSAVQSGQHCNDTYSVLAGEGFSKLPGETSKRLEGGSHARLKYDATAQQDGEIIRRVAELTDQHDVTMTEISLVWLLTKVTAPAAGATKLHHIEDANKAVELTLTAVELAYLEESYIPHALVGVMVQNAAAIAKEKHVWSTDDQTI